ncbi:MAG: PTS IIA-like nitrogen regulatory protein PtsN [Burkholderiales bacterium]
MHLISQLLHPDHIALDLDIASKKRLFEQIGLIFENTQQISHSVVFDSLLSRERLGSTGLGYGVAIPHGRLKKLRDATAVFVRTLSPIPFESPDGQPVNLIFVVLVPEHATEQHLQILSELAQVFSDPAIRGALTTCASADDAYRILTDWSSYAPRQRSAAL